MRKHKRLRLKEGAEERRIAASRDQLRGWDGRGGETKPTHAFPKGTTWNDTTKRFDTEAQISGDIWVDQETHQVSVYNGTEWTTLPEGTS